MKLQRLNKNKFADETYLNLLEKVDFSPIFIMGDHRSGTTLLYELLAATQCFNFVTSYNVIKYDQLLSNYVENKENKVREELKDLFQSQNLKHRVIDHVKISLDLPEEYGFILNQAGYFPQKINSESLALFNELCKKIQFISNSDKPLLLKNPWDFANFMYIKKVFPKAKFIFLHRNPIHVINSKLKAIRTILAEQDTYTALLWEKYRLLFNKPVHLFLYRMLYSSHFGIGLKKMTQETVSARNYFMQNIDQLSPTDYISIKYEDLCQEPKAKLFNILSFLGLEQRSNLMPETLVQPRRLNLLPEVDQKSNHIYSQLQQYCTHQGYIH